MGGIKNIRRHQIKNQKRNLEETLKRNPHLDITVIEPAEKHYYQPGWTMVGAGVFNKEQTERTMDSV